LFVCCMYNRENGIKIALCNLISLNKSKRFCLLCSVPIFSQESFLFHIVWWKLFKLCMYWSSKTFFLVFLSCSVISKDWNGGSKKKKTERTRGHMGLCCGRWENFRNEKEKFYYTHIECLISSHLQVLLKVTYDCMLCMTNTFQHRND